MEQDLLKIMRDYCNDFHKNTQCFSDKIVPNSFPIVWFGDIEKYQASPIKIVTIGLNPSWHEFLEKDRTPLAVKRFRKIDFVSHDENELNELYVSLKDYFRLNPYRHYFDGYEFALRYIGASYGGKMLNEKTDSMRYIGASYDGKTDSIAVHIDVFSAIATTVLFSDCSKELFEKLINPDLFQKLFSYLSPNVVLASIGKQHEDAWRMIGGGSFCFDKERDIFKGKYENELEAYRNENRLIVYGRNRQRPFNVKDKEMTLEQASETLLTELVKTVARN